MTIARKVEFDGARANHQAILRLETAHGRDSDQSSDLLRDRLVRRVSKTELGSDRAATLAEVGDLNALSPKHARQHLGLSPSVTLVWAIADQHARRHSRGQRRQRGEWV